MFATIDGYLYPCLPVSWNRVRVPMQYARAFESKRVAGGPISIDGRSCYVADIVSAIEERSGEVEVKLLYC
jgi:hypothetical protein